MRLQVVVDSVGVVVGTVRAGTHQLPDGSEMEVGVVALEGQVVHEINYELEGDVLQEDVEQFHLKLGRLLQEAGR